MTISWRLANPIADEEIKSLEILIEDTDSNVLAFALYNSTMHREAAVRSLKERLDLPVVEYTLSRRLDNPLECLAGLDSQERACVFFYNLEEALPRFSGYVNLQREAFADVPHAVVFWVREYGLREIATKAPDFWAWRSGVFDFRSGEYEGFADVMRAAADMPAAAVMTVASGEPLIFQDRGDLERRISLYQGLINEYSQQEQPDERFIARLELRLANGFHYLGRFHEAEEFARRVLERSQSLEDQELEADALNKLGVLAVEPGRFSDAEDYFRRSLLVGEKINNKELVALGYNNLGIIAHEHQRLIEAEEWYRKALEIFERMGFEGDVANSYFNLGRIAQDRNKLDEAEKWYRQALEINERLGLERSRATSHNQIGKIPLERQWYRQALKINGSLGLERSRATSYNQMGNISLERQRFDKAEEWYRKALEVWERLGNPPLMVNTLAQLGLLRKLQGKHSEAELWFGTALSIANEYNMRDQLRILAELAQVMNDIGEEQFVSNWREAFDDQEPPLEALREISRQMITSEAVDSP